MLLRSFIMWRKANGHGSPRRTGSATQKAPAGSNPQRGRLSFCSCILMFVLGVVALARECLHVDTSTCDVRLHTQHVGICAHMDIPEFRPVIICYGECQLRWRATNKPKPKWQPAPKWPQQPWSWPVHDRHHVIDLGDATTPVEPAATTLDTVGPIFTTILSTVVNTLTQHNEHVVATIGRQMEASHTLGVANLNNVVQQMHRNNMEQHHATMTMMQRFMAGQCTPDPNQPAAPPAAPTPPAGPPGGMPAPPGGTPPPPPPGWMPAPWRSWRRSPPDPKDIFCGLHM